MLKEAIFGASSSFEISSAFQIWACVTSAVLITLKRLGHREKRENSIAKKALICLVFHTEALPGGHTCRSFVTRENSQLGPRMQVFTKQAFFTTFYVYSPSLFQLGIIKLESIYDSVLT